ncbi:MAG: translation elongation factor G [Candidatus Lambdaproteobacteria bacterium RIFOXYD1_FULL_56_27]|uniref:Elongation factor G n=1 Tax=Candidatus Lambdaproteobacteria bacterium RIFOXYD2_FULL_56_26 TaxID=1817773 RepID=A0A1F6GUS3_9PROT|nr:MAG: translation elongation factor G [Candidatus Lambdaproteobacteria bacterium RIFOXYD2_FULL_56_26]OGH02292.1 MAG: translation elongation factor G [Candidatus Lambdaproteobacteria bacterium RIFOXYC1_FULL_56_13]OGH10062.1 MAG: translation elongation factor G [Candidatus Lambdaproteobacteria bacterium RIFOXYD1_FULL_56_27]
MKEINNMRNIGISAHIDSGKTTLTERILYYAGKIHKIEEVRGGGAGATMDHMELEKEKGITITSAATTVYWHDKKINIIDTPGHVDFTVEVERSLRVLDGAIMVLCAVAGVQSQSITVDRQMKRYSVPRLCFINKMDRTGADPWKGIKDLREKLGHNAVAMQLPIGEEDGFVGVVDLVTMKAIYNEGEKGDDVIVKDIPAELQEDAELRRAEMLDAVSMFNDELMEALLEGKEVPEEIIHKAIWEGINSLKFTPVYMGSAFKNKAVQPLLDAVVRYLPSPIEARPTKATKVDNGEVIYIKTDPQGPLVLMAFKITEEQFGQLTYCRVYSGTLEKGSTIYNVRTGKKLRVGRIVRMHANDRENIDTAKAGDIVALIGVDCASGDTFCDESLKVVLESMFIAEPVISLAIKCKDNTAIDRMSKALSRFMKEDPTFRVSTDEESGETIIKGMGELHLEIYVERMLREYNVQVQVGAPQVNYREAITTKASYDYTHKKQTGGSGQYACVMGEIEPIDFTQEGALEFEFVNNIKGGSIPSEFIGACQMGFKDIMIAGPLAAFPMVGVRVFLVDGKYHDVDSSDMAFRICARQAMKQAVRKANPVLLEPMMHVEVETPSEFQGGVIGDLSSRRGIIGGTEMRDEMTVVTATVPLSEMFGYSTSLRSATQGKATFSMEFDSYASVPRNLQEEVIRARAEKLKEDE